MALRITGLKCVNGSAQLWPWASVSCDYLADLPVAAHRSIGMKAYVAEDGKYYVVDSNNNWVLDTANFGTDGFAVELRTSDPSAPLPGQMWLRTNL